MEKKVNQINRVNKIKVSVIDNITYYYCTTYYPETCLYSLTSDRTCVCRYRRNLNKCTNSKAIKAKKGIVDEII